MYPRCIADTARQPAPFESAPFGKPLVNASHETHLHDMTSAFRESDMAGWHVQQVIPGKCNELTPIEWDVLLLRYKFFLPLVFFLASGPTICFWLIWTPRALGV